MGLFKFDLKKPCANCPFRKDIPFFLSKARATDIVNAVTKEDKTFSCHKTVTYGDDGESVFTPKEQHCAGALILVAKTGAANSMLQIAERFGIYDPAKIDMDAPVYDTGDDMIAAMRD